MRAPEPTAPSFVFPPILCHVAPLDALILLAFIVYALVVGLRSRRQASEGLDEYFLAGRSLRGWQAGASMAATQFAARPCSSPA